MKAKLRKKKKLKFIYKKIVSVMKKHTLFKKKLRKKKHFGQISQNLNFFNQIHIKLKNKLCVPRYKTKNS